MGMTDVETLIIGAGISGIGAAIGLRRVGHDDFTILERAPTLGGTWRDNTYPGVAVDIPSSSYCFAFETDYPWSHAYASGAEILKYVHHCARKYDIERHIQYGASVIRASLEDDRWRVALADGRALTARFLIAATGLFTTPVLPDIDGLDTFAGTSFHSARWDHSHDLSGRRVGVIGTGASAAQIIPAIADTVAHLHVFQRTPIWIAPRLDYRLPAPNAWHNLRRFGAFRAVNRWVSEMGIEILTLATAVYQRSPLLVQGVQRLVRAWMARQVTDPDIRRKLLPTYTLGCKRPTPSNTYLKTFNRPHVRLVTTPIAAIEPSGVRTVDETLHAIDTLVLATGFLTTQRGNAPAFEAIGRDGIPLGAVWDAQRLQSYRGVAMPGFPNLFLTAGPYSGGFNWFTMLSAHLDQIIGCIQEAGRRNARMVEVDPQAHAEWMMTMWRYAEETVFTAPSCHGSNSFYIDRHGDAALPLPRTPGWRARMIQNAETQGFVFSQ
ncbi:MAG: NAD(P)/FAD-dependent oxidoreductase [Myxococcota bacterium]